MDDVQYGWNSGVQASVVDWALANKVKFNFGIITGPDPNGQTWPTTCSSHPKDTACDDPAVASIYKAYDSGAVAGPNTLAKDAVVEIFNHAWDHDSWSTMSDSQQHADMKKSARALSAAYPKASIKTFVPPQNMADAGTVKAAKDNGLSIISSMGTLACPSDWKGSPPRYNYQYAPCQGE
jgi:peptidoglycan/xylan/chitin deacetylase (PgdA/CDA1 family)